ncbi:E3 ubiquitin-protein ligase DZIP3, partial [Exaiptasia diaphana]|uniref:DZIP3-like HEPN domain-containing protein n=1 Tax=Exaiptasia diaphana TaxID=2652724 RepID=A0A913Y0J5_EXADI
MAEAALALQESPDTERFQRVAVLLVRGGTIIIRGLFDNIHPPLTLVRALKIHRATLDDLRRRRILNSDQWKKLFPSPDAYGQTKDFDLTLIFVLLRNICNLTEPANGWNNLPANISDISLEDDLARIKYHRNNTYAHTMDGQLSEDEFNECWDEISDALLRILTFYDTPESVRNWEKEIKKLRRGPISLKDIQAWLAGFP